MQAESSAEIFLLSSEWYDGAAGHRLRFYGRSQTEGVIELLFDERPSFYVHSTTQIGPTPVLYSRVTEGLKAFDKKPVDTLYFQRQNDLESVASMLRSSGTIMFESDLRPAERFLMKNRVNAQLKVTGRCIERGTARTFYNPIISGSSVAPEFRVASLDIETGVYSGQLYSIAVHCFGLREESSRVFMLGRENSGSWASLYPDERSLINAFIEWFTREDPDLLIGWNIAGFDLSFLQRKCENLKLRLAIGRGGRPLSIFEGRRKASRVSIPGRAVLDGIWALRGAFYNFEDFRLGTVARALLGRDKLISANEDKIKEIERLFKHDKAGLAAYNLEDAVLVSDIFRKTQLIDLYARRSQISGLLFEQVGLSAAALDHFYVSRLHEKGFVAPDVIRQDDFEASAGGYVFDPEPGIHSDILVLDFQSLYPSIIRTFKIDPLARACSDVDPLTTPTGHKFSRQMHLLPDYIGHLIELREGARGTNAHLSQAVKILMNSFYGVMGSQGSRFYHPDLPAAITGTGQWILKNSQQYLESLGHRVIYGDTDSLFVKPGASGLSGEALGRALADQLSSYWTTRIRADFGQVSFLKAKFEKEYAKLLLPAARNHSGGAKKRYAGLVRKGESERLDFVGMEVVRSDWTPLAKHFQTELYGRIFRGQEVEEWIRSYVKALKSGSLNDKLIYRRRLLKPAEEYTKSVPPYVKAARMLETPSREVAYVVTSRGPIPAEMNPSDIDYKHYINKQLKPVADSILGFLNMQFDELIKDDRQLKLF